MTARSRSVVTAAEAAGLLAGENTMLSVRVPRALLEGARKGSGISSTTELVKYALAKVALEDNFGAKLTARRGSIPADIELDI